MAAKDYRTEAEVLKIIESNHIRDSNYCRYCGKKGGSSIGNHTYSKTHHYHWWHCRNCGRDYDLIIQEYKTPLTERTPLDNARKKPGKKG